MERIPNSGGEECTFCRGQPPVLIKTTRMPRVDEINTDTETILLCVFCYCGLDAGELSYPELHSEGRETRKLVNAGFNTLLNQLREAPSLEVHGVEAVVSQHLLQRLHDGGVSFSVDVWDVGLANSPRRWNVMIGNRNGSMTATCHTFEEACDWLRERALQLYPNSAFAKAERAKEEGAGG